MKIHVDKCRKCIMFQLNATIECQRYCWYENVVSTTVLWIDSSLFSAYNVKSRRCSCPTEAYILKLFTLIIIFFSFFFFKLQKFIHHSLERTFLFSCNETKKSNRISPTASIWVYHSENKKHLTDNNETFVFIIASNAFYFSDMF